MTTTLRELGVGHSDEHELIWQYIGAKDLDVPLLVSELTPADLAGLSAGMGGNLLQAFRRASTDQRQLVAELEKSLKAGSLSEAERTIILHVDRLVDGHHRAVAAIRAKVPLRCVDLADLPN